MKITVKGAGKKFGHNWIFKNIDTSFEKGNSYAITGNNGSGKTTLIKALAGITPLSIGTIEYSKQDGAKINADDFFNYITLAGPYTELIEEFTLLEVLQFYSKFKELTLSNKELLENTGFNKVKNLSVKFFSSGMKQKLKLALAMFTNSKVVFLDEPTSNLDKENTSWYLENIEKATIDKILIICSNQQYEYSFCREVLNVNMFK
ncbi:ABC transporter ATP-binding protein [Chondrinema litorale]|uniref:ABC transporter ATP-binding protein n=1 Tax=Chondrinema litorale TaxID=2994555 RepID=UPI00254276B6|nr:ATP-binding cassette domain-containing protein [Chondrinema litorale]UZR94388.1 ATP-binding cassette domain-containing protein [Chondrinema litorale]